MTIILFMVLIKLDFLYIIDKVYKFLSSSFIYECVQIFVQISVPFVKSDFQLGI